MFLHLHLLLAHPDGMMTLSTVSMKVLYALRMAGTRCEMGPLVVMARIGPAYWLCLSVTMRSIGHSDLFLAAIVLQTGLAWSGNEVELFGYWRVKDFVWARGVRIKPERRCDFQGCWHRKIAVVMASSMNSVFVVLRRSAARRLHPPLLYRVSITPH